MNKKLSLQGKTALITGASRGIGQAIALRYTSAGVNVVLIDKENPTHQISKANGKTLALNLDLNNAADIKQAVSEAIKQFGGIDILINNVSAFCFADTLNIAPEQFDTLMSTNVRATFLVSQACIPYLKKARNPHIINISPPLNMESRWFKDHVAFSLSKCGMSLCTLGMAAEFQGAGVAVNSLWPRTTIATTTIEDHFSSKVYEGSRWPSIMADAAYELAQRESQKCTGHFFIDESLLRETGIIDFSNYAVNPQASLIQDLFVSEKPQEGAVPMTPISSDLYIPAAKDEA